MREVGKKRAGFNYSKYLSSDQNASGLELLPKPKFYLHQNPIFTRFCPEAKRHLVGEESQEAVRDDPKSDQTGVEGECEERRENSP
jgi:hypothetical protein